MGAPAPESEIATPWTLPTDVLIVARSDLPTLVRSAATCKDLRRDIVSLPFICRVAKQVAPSILDYCTYDERPLTLVHPITPTIMSFCHYYLSPYMSRRNAGLLYWYYPVTSHSGLVVLRLLLHIDMPSKSECSSKLWVYDPITHHHTFLSKPCTRPHTPDNWQYVLLTAADGIICSFMLLFFDRRPSKARFWLGYTVLNVITSSSRAWGSVTSPPSNLDFPLWYINKCSAPVVLHGGIIHWLMNYVNQILTYDVRTGASGRVNLPPNNRKGRQLHLVTSPDAPILKLLSIKGFKISVWLQLPTVQPGGCWLLENVIDIENKLRSMCPDIPHGHGNAAVYFTGSGKRSGDVVLLEVCHSVSCQMFVVLDLDTNEMRAQKKGSSLLEIDLSCYLETMKVFY
ncbi:hypothetical protein VPH35_126888 [Triticum aestivum]